MPKTPPTEAQKRAQQRWRSRNADKVHQYNQKYYNENKEQLLRIQKEKRARLKANQNILGENINQELNQHPADNQLNQLNDQLNDQLNQPPVNNQQDNTDHTDDQKK